MVHPQQEARELYERTNALVDSARTTLYEAIITHNQLVEKTKEQFPKAEACEIEQWEIFKPFQKLAENFTQETISYIWADEASWPLHK